MARPDHDDHAQSLAHESLNGDYGDEAYRLRVAALSQTYALLAVAEAIEDMSRALVENLGRGVMDGSA